MNRRRSSKPTLGMGSVIMLIAAALVIASAGVFHAYIKNRQVNVTRDIQRVEERIAQHELDIQTYQMRLDEALNRFLIRDRLKEISSDLRSITAKDVREIPSAASRSSLAGRGAGGNSVTRPVSLSFPVSDFAHQPSPPGDLAVASGP